MGELQVTRWRRYGRDRLYVNAAAGLLIGWVDLITGHVTTEQPAYADALNIAVARHHVENASTPAATSVGRLGAQIPSPRPSTEETWVDLAGNRPGQGAREHAQAELAAMKRRSRVRTFLAMAFDNKTDERAWRIGAGGEKTVGGRLERLVPYGWHVLHSVPVSDRGSDIDHVLVGHGGVYTLNTKTHPNGRVWVGQDSVRVNGHPMPYLQKSRYEAGRAERLLSAAAGFPVHVRPALVFLTGMLFPNVTIKDASQDVVILGRMDIPGFFKRARSRLMPEQVDVIFEQARRSTTWVT